MRQIGVATIAAVLAAATVSSASAGPLERGCLRSDRPGATRAMCGCIQAVADGMLTRGDQRMAARFFRDPHRAQEVRQSDNPRHERFWQDYRAFGDRVEQTCAAYR